MNISAQGYPRVDLFPFSDKTPSMADVARNSRKGDDSFADSRLKGCSGPVLTPEDKAILERAAKEALEQLASIPEPTIGFLGSGEYDLYYFPKGVEGLQYAPVGEKAPDWSQTIAHNENCWNEFYKVLSEFGINHNDSDSMQSFFKDPELRAAVEAEYEKRI